MLPRAPRSAVRMRRAPPETSRSAGRRLGDVDAAQRDRPEPDAPKLSLEEAPARSTWRDAVVLVLATRLFLMLVGYAAAWYLAGDGDPTTVDPVLLWDKWDATLLL